MTAPPIWPMDASVVAETMLPQPAAFLDAIADEGLGLPSITVQEVLDGVGCLAPGKRRPGAAIHHHVPGSFLAAGAAMGGLAGAIRNTDALRNTGVETIDPWTAGLP